MEKRFTNRDGKEWRVRFHWPGTEGMATGQLDFRPGGVLEPSGPVAWFYHPADPSKTREKRSVDLQGDEDLDTMTDQELMDLLDEATP